MATKSKKAPHEEEAIKRFMAFLRETRRTGYHVIDHDVVVDLATGTNYDYQLAAEGQSTAAIAVEIFRLIEEEDLAAERRRGMLWEAIKREFVAVGLSDLLVSTPDRVSVLPRDQPKFVKALAQVALRKLSEHPKAKMVRLVRLDGGIELRRFKGLGTHPEGTCGRS